jgi:hypothetical protein
MACSIGAVFAALTGGGDMYGDADPDEVAGYVRAAVHDLFPASRRSSALVAEVSISGIGRR